MRKNNKIIFGSITAIILSLGLGLGLGLGLKNNDVSNKPLFLEVNKPIETPNEKYCDFFYWGGYNNNVVREEKILTMGAEIQVAYAITDIEKDPYWKDLYDISEPMSSNEWFAVEFTDNCDLEWVVQDY